MGFEMKAYPKLIAEFDRQVIALLGHHKVVSHEKLPHPRREQVQFLKTAIDGINVLELPQFEDNEKKDAERSRILNGLMLIVLEQIRNEYIYTAPENSFLLNCLVAVVGVSDENKLDNNSQSCVLSAAQNFIKGLIFENGLTTNPLLEEHPFSHIPKLNMKSIWTTGVALKALAENGIFNDAEAELQKTIQKREEEATAARKEKTKGYSSWFGSKKDTPKVEIHDPKAMANPEGSTSTATL